jgi:DNA-binding SARP family transcriptional activator
VVLTIELLGRPAVRVDGVDLDPPRDRKTWALLAYLALVEAAPSRQRLAELLFPNAGDPLAAVRWNLTQVRHLLGAEILLGGDPVELTLPADTVLDVDVLLRGRWTEAALLPTGQELLEGLTFDSAPAFELWLTGRRRHLRASAAAVLHEAAMANLARDPQAAVQLAERLVAIAPHDENCHVLLVRALVSCGRMVEAAQRAVECAAFLERELGVQPSGALRDALAGPAAMPLWPPTAVSVLAQLESGTAAVTAGSWATGIDHLRQAVASARQLTDERLRARTLVALGAALVHAARGQDEEGAASLHEGGELAEACGEQSVAATAWRELAWVEFLRGRHSRARLWLARAATAAGADAAELAWIALISGASRSDTGSYAEAEHDLLEAVGRADGAGLVAPGAFARSFLGRLHLLRGELDEAESVLRVSIEQALAIGWTSMLPWPRALLADVELHRGDLDAAGAIFEHAFTMGRQLGDPCWESVGARGLGLVAISRGEVEPGVRMLEQAPSMCRRLPDSYLWIEAYATEAMCAVAVDRHLPAAGQWIAELEALAAGAGFLELGVLALYYRARLGEPGAAEAARAAADQIDNPTLRRRLAELDA